MSLLSILTVVNARSTDAATKSANALDLDSDKFPEPFKCPICFELYRQEIYQCSNGHMICNNCVVHMTDCPQCKVPLSVGQEGVVTRIRNRGVEELMDKILVPCPFKKNGCLETFPRQVDPQVHARTCLYDRTRSSSIQLCRLLGFPDACNFLSKTREPQKIIDHLVNEHRISIYSDPDSIPEETVSVTNFTRLYKRCLAAKVGKPAMCSLWDPSLMKAFGGTILIGSLFNLENVTFSFVAIGIENSSQDSDSVTEVDFVIHLPTKLSKKPRLAWTIPVVPLQKAEQVIREPPFRVPAAELEKYCVSKSDVLKYTATASRIVVLSP